MQLIKFFRPTLNKIVIAKALGIPLLIADSLFRIFSGANFMINAVVLLAASYSISCVINHYLQGQKVNATWK